MSRRIIHSVTFTDLRPLLWKGIPVYKRIEGIRRILATRNRGLEYLFCEPLITDAAARMQDEAHWLTDLADQGAVVNYNALSPDRQEDLLSRLKQDFEVVSSLAGELKQSVDADQRELGEVLLLAMQIPSLDCIYAVGDHILLVAWGFVGRNENDANYTFNIHRVLERIPPVAAPPVTPSGAGKPPLPPMETPPVTPPAAAPPAAPPLITPPPKKEETPPPPPPRRKTWFFVGGSILFLLLLIALAWWLHRPKTITTYLPPEANHFLPFDSSKVIIDTPDDPKMAGIGGKIVGNRLNARIDPKVPLKDFAVRFKTKFPDDAEVKIIFYDTVFHSVQIEFYRQDLKYWRTQLQRFRECTGIFKERVYTFSNIPSDPGFTVDSVDYPYQLTGVYNAWDATQGDSVVIAVIDNGFDVHHPELEGRIWKPYNTADKGPDVSYGIFQGNFHGTHVAALAAGTANNGAGASGFAPRCYLMPIQVFLGANSTYGLIAALDHAIKQGADVINLSIGSSLPEELKNLSYQQQLDYIEQNESAKVESELFESRYELANSVNAIIVEAAGNDNVVSALDPMKRSEFILNVGACDVRLNKASFSNYGKAVTITAPGVNIFSAYPGDKYAFLSGTSMACPIVAGGVALMKSIKKDLTVSEARQILVETGLPLNPSPYEMGPLVQFGKAIKRLLAGNNACQDRSDSLQQVVDSLEKRLKDQTAFLLIPPHVTDCSFATGVWYSSRDVFDLRDKQPVQLEFRFNQDCEGEIYYVEKNETCQAPITMTIDNGVFSITQMTVAECNTTDHFEQYDFKCTPDADGVAHCQAFPRKSNLPVVEFKLYKN